jgi:N-dimethylarginine dimethylaminohydrolase
MSSTAHSEYGTIQQLFIKNVQAAFLNDEHIAAHWEALNYLGQPNMQQSLHEYASFENILQSQGAQIFYFPTDESVNMDSVYCRDAAIATNQGMIICNMGKEGRKNEPLAQQKAFEANGIKVLGVIQAPGTLEGGEAVSYTHLTLPTSP